MKVKLKESKVLGGKEYTKGSTCEVTDRRAKAWIASGKAEALKQETVSDGGSGDHSKTKS